MKKKRKNRGFCSPYMRAGLILVLLFILILLAGKLLIPYGPNEMNAAQKLHAPSMAHWMGTDHLGRDVFARVLDGFGTSFLIAFSTVLIGTAVGVVIGALTGYFGGWPDEILMRMNDVITAFPSLLLALVFVGILGMGGKNVIIALGIAFIPSFARMVRGEFIRYKEAEFIKSVRLMGAGNFRIMFVHILPNILPTLLASIAIGFNNAMLAEAGMSYLGIGVQPPDASLGKMMSEAQSYLFTAPWYGLFPGLVIVLTVLAVSFFSEGLKEMAN